MKNFRLLTLVFISFLLSIVHVFCDVGFAEARSCDGIWNPIKRIDCERLIIKEQIEDNITKPLTESATYEIKKARDAAIEAGDEIDAKITRPVLIKPIERLGDFLASSSEQWGEAGRSGLYVAKAKIASDNLIVVGESIPDMFKPALRQKYGDIVDRVQVKYGANLLNNMCIFQNKVCMDLGNTDAQTFGDTIYVKAKKPAPEFKDYIAPIVNGEALLVPNVLHWDRFFLNLLAHELKHVQQYRDAGSTGRFGYEYFKSYKEVNQNYENINKEVEAREYAEEFLSYTCSVKTRTCTK